MLLLNVPATAALWPPCPLNPTSAESQTLRQTVNYVKAKVKAETRCGLISMLTLTDLGKVVLCDLGKVVLLCHGFRNKHGSIILFVCLFFFIFHGNEILALVLNCLFLCVR